MRTASVTLQRTPLAFVKKFKIFNAFAKVAIRAEQFEFARPSGNTGHLFPVLRKGLGSKFLWQLGSSVMHKLSNKNGHLPHFKSCRSGSICATYKINPVSSTELAMQGKDGG